MAEVEDSGNYFLAEQNHTNIFLCLCLCLGKRNKQCRKYVETGLCAVTFFPLRWVALLPARLFPAIFFGEEWSWEYLGNELAALRMMVILQNQERRLVGGFAFRWPNAFGDRHLLVTRQQTDLVVVAIDGCFVCTSQYHLDIYPGTSTGLS